MDRVPSSWTAFMVFLLLLLRVSSESVEVRQALVHFMDNIFPVNAGREVSWGWNSSSDPCDARWKGVDCLGTSSVRKVVLEDINLTGILDASSLCVAKSLAVLSLSDNNIVGNLPVEISNCNRLTHLYLSGNNFTGNLPNSLSRLSNLKRLDISNNDFSGVLPDLSRISGLLTFLAENNQLSGKIPDFDFSNLVDFNVSFNNFSGPTPNVNGHFGASSFLGNPELCGQPLSNACPTPLPPTPPAKKKHSSSKQCLIYSGYAILALIIILLLAYTAFKRKKHNDGAKNAEGSEIVSSMPNSTSSDSKNRGSRSEFSITSPDNGKTSSLVVLSSPVVNGLKLEDLLRAPAELVGRGKHGTLYKVTLNNSVTLAVKRIKDWEISRDDFKKRMQRVNEVKHANVLPVVAYYSSQQEKLLVYEFQQNGSLFRRLNGYPNGELFDWGSRLNVAVSAANALAFMHQELHNDGIAHGNLKSSNILLNKDMGPCISEYGLMKVENDEEQLITQTESIEDNDATQGSKKIFTADIYSFGVILLELLTGKVVHNRSSDLAKWVHSVVREEWTAEVFDKALISEGASEERMVTLLHVALKCINPSLDARPSSSQVAVIINSIKEDEEKSTNNSSEL